MPSSFIWCRGLCFIGCWWWPWIIPCMRIENSLFIRLRSILGKKKLLSFFPVFFFLRSLLIFFPSLNLHPFWQESFFNGPTFRAKTWSFVSATCSQSQTHWMCMCLFVCSFFFHWIHSSWLAGWLKRTCGYWLPWQKSIYLSLSWLLFARRRQIHFSFSFFLLRLLSDGHKKKLETFPLNYVKYLWLTQMSVLVRNKLFFFSFRKKTNAFCMKYATIERDVGRIIHDWIYMRFNKIFFKLSWWCLSASALQFAWNQATAYSKSIVYFDCNLQGTIYIAKFPYPSLSLAKTNNYFTSISHQLRMKLIVFVSSNESNLQSPKKYLLLLSDASE